VINTEALKVVVTAGVPPLGRMLLWDVFFTSKKRGVSLSVHFPWIDNDENVFCIGFYTAEPVDKKIIATLVIKIIDVPANKHIGLIGFVCVAEEWRGLGLGARLISEAVKFGENNNLDAMALWTKSPRIYTSHGFISDKQEMFGSVKKKSANRCDIMFSTEPWPDAASIKSQQGLPPFASQAKLIKTELASAVVLETQGDRFTVAKWQGKDEDVADLLEASLPDNWSFNVSESDGIVRELLKRNFEVSLEPAAVRMAKNLKNSPMPDFNVIEFLDRV
jgi:GNAT superfamily N-acetyltransferase